MNVSQQSPLSTPPTPPPASKPVPVPNLVTAQYADPLEQRDPWRALWNFCNSDVLLIILSAAVLLILLIALALPQTPAGGTTSPVAYAEWQSRARILTGVFYGPFNSLGLFDVSRSAGFKLLLVLFAGIVGLRLFNDVARMRLANMPAEVLRDEMRLRVTAAALSLPHMSQQLRRMRYRVIMSSPTPVPTDASDWLHANHAPFAELLSALFHGGILLALFGALLNYLLGWQVLYGVVTPDQAKILPANQALSIQPAADAPTDTLTLMLQPTGAQAALRSGERTTLSNVNVRLRQITPGLRVSASQNGQPVTLTVSNYSAGRRDVLLSFSANDRERAFVLPSVALMARVVISSEDALGSGRLQMFSLGSGALITDTPLQAQLLISNTAITFISDTGALLDVDYRPGMFWLWLGLVLALIGFIGVLFYPVQRLVIRHHGHWTEFYGSGRQIRRTIMGLLTAVTAVESTGTTDG